MAAKKLNNNDLINDIEFLADFQLLVGAVFRFNGALLGISEKICSNDKLITVPIWRIIAVLRRQPMTVSAISRYLGHKRQSIQVTVNQMKKLGLVTLRQNPMHKKSFLIALTPKGQKTIEQIYEYQKNLTEFFIKDLEISLTDTIKTSEFLRTLRENAKKNLKKSLN